MTVSRPGLPRGGPARPQPAEPWLTADQLAWNLAVQRGWEWCPAGCGWPVDPAGGSPVHPGCEGRRGGGRTVRPAVRRPVPEPVDHRCELCPGRWARLYPCGWRCDACSPGAVRAREEGRTAGPADEGAAA